MLRGLAHDGLVWRRFARFGAAHGPGWFLACAPPVLGLLMALLLPKARRAVRDNLRRIRGRVGWLREARDVAHTFTSFAGCFAEVLASGSKNGATPELTLEGREHIEAALSLGKGLVIVTAHTAGWEVVGPVLRIHKGLDVVMVMEAERDPEAREVSDRARRASGVLVAHVGHDPFASLPLLHRLRDGAAVALQIDRVPVGMRSLEVRMLGESREVPEGPLRLAQLSGAPIVPFLCARLGRGRYLAQAFPPCQLARRAPPPELAAVAQRLADDVTSFVTRYPTQWFDFSPRA